MNTKRARGVLLTVSWILTVSPLTGLADDPVVTIDNFRRAESDLYFAKFVSDGAFGKFTHARDIVPVDEQDVIRMNRDTLYSYAVVDLTDGPVRVSIPDTGGRFVALQVIDEDHYTPAVLYSAGEHKIDSRLVPTRYALLLARTFVDPDDPKDLETVHRLQDQRAVTQASTSEFSVPAWDTVSAGRIRDALNGLAAANGGIDSARMFGARGDVDPIQHLIGTAAGWGGNPREDALYDGASTDSNDGQSVYQLTVRDVPADGFWSVSVYNADGFFEKNARGAYSVNNVTAATNPDGSVTVRFSGCDKVPTNCLPITDGWNYLVRMYRPRAEILDGRWSFPKAQLIE